MATKKKLLQAAAGSAGGADDAINVEDVFATYIYQGNGEGQVIANGLKLGQSGEGGSAFFNNNNQLVVDDDADFQFGGGDWTVEAFVYAHVGTSDFVIAGWGEDGDNRFDFGWQSSSAPRVRIGQAGVQYDGYASSSYALSNYVNTWVHVAAVRNGNTVSMYIDGTSVLSFSYSETDFPQPSTGGVGIGSRWYTGRTGLTNEAFGHISNFRIVKGTAVYTSNFTAPTSELTAVTNTSLLCLQGSDPLTDASGNSHSITQSSLNGTSTYADFKEVVPSTFGPFDATDADKGGLVWIKNRGDATADHSLWDTERGAFKYIKSNTSDTEVSLSSFSTGLTAFNSNGFTLSGGDKRFNKVDNDFASWTWRKAERFFDCVTYTGNGTSGRTVSHNLGSVPGMIIVKSMSNGSSWQVYHRSVTDSPETKYLVLNSTGSFNSGTSRWNDTAPTSTEFTVGNDSSVNNSGSTYVAYLFAHNDGDGTFGPDGDQDIIKCGICSGESGSNRDIDLGFEPQWIMTKAIDTTSNWRILDEMRGWAGGHTSSTSINNRLIANDFTAETTDDTLSIQPYGFYVNGLPGSGDYLYMAIRRGPMAVPTDATKVFEALAYTGDGTANRNIGRLKIDMNLTMDRTNTSSGLSSYHTIFDRLRGEDVALKPDNTGSESTGWRDTYYNLDHQYGFSVGTDSNYHNINNGSYITYTWKRAPHYFDQVCYAGTGVSGRTVEHNLGVVPEMMWVKNRSATKNWIVYHKGLNGGTNPEQYDLHLNSSGAETTSASSWNNTAPTSSVFTLGNSTTVNGNADNYIAYLFATTDGVSKVGFYTGTGSTQNIDCGFSNGAKLVIIRNASNGESWYVLDSARGYSTTADPFLYLESGSLSEVAGANFINTYSAGFTVVGSDSSRNQSGVDYIFYAVA